MWNKTRSSLSRKHNPLEWLQMYFFVGEIFVIKAFKKFAKNILIKSVRQTSQLILLKSDPL